MSYTRNIKFVTSQAEEEILDIPEVKEMVMEMISCRTDEQYEVMKQQGIVMEVVIFTKDTRIKLNNELYNDLVENTVYTTGGLTRVHSIKSENNISATITFRMRGE